MNEMPFGTSPNVVGFARQKHPETRMGVLQPAERFTRVIQACEYICGQTVPDSSNNSNKQSWWRKLCACRVVRLLWKKLTQPNSDQLSRMLCKGEKEDPRKV